MRRRKALTIGKHRVSVHGGATVHEIDGRLLARTVDRSDGPWLERLDVAALDGYPELDPARRIELSATWPKVLEHAQPLLDASPNRHRSFRSWQRRVRHVGGAVRSDGVRLARLHAELGRGAWMPAPPDSPRHDGSSQSTVLALPIEVAMIGVAVLELLVEPPIAG